MKLDSLRAQLSQKGLKITPQRIAIYEAVVKLKNHPTADNIIEYIKKNHPNISVGTVYKVLDSLVVNELLRKVKNEKDVMRYDAILHQHHHLYCSETDRIEDFEDQDLDSLIKNYFAGKKIKGFKIKDITLQISGEFKN
ncbi:MAG: transcriptional repressor [Bacteroidetes bacterium]|nr:transcriptional repressor [Bacteroidota bacterium]MBK9670799.1 transcriptional repressor [Bacteroidota bacterium]MBK9801135.1 transcriptional repressor [Bacteroidota bacterium]MBP6414750.1 transcriptional repressor [Bacteroidia bacterium]